MPTNLVDMDMTTRWTLPLRSCWIMKFESKGGSLWPYYRITPAGLLKLNSYDPASPVQADSSVFGTMSTSAGGQTRIRSRVKGMEMRDEFAARAMQGIVSSIDSEENYQRLKAHAETRGIKLSQWIAKDAYKQADAMVKESQLQQSE